MKTDKFDSKKIDISGLEQKQGDDFNEEIEQLKAEKSETSEQTLKGMRVSNEMIIPLFELGNRYIGKRWGEICKLDDDEINSLVNYTGVILNKYVPSVVAGYSAETTLSILVLTIFLEKRSLYTKEVKKKVKKGVESERKSDRNNLGKEGARKDTLDTKPIKTNS